MCVFNWFHDSSSQHIWKVEHAFCWILLNVLCLNGNVCWFGNEESRLVPFNIILCCFTEFSASILRWRIMKVMITCLRSSCFQKDPLFLICVYVCVWAQLHWTAFDPMDCSPPGSSLPGILQGRILEWVAISFSNAGKWKVKVKSLSRIRLLATPWTAAYQTPPSVGFSRQEFWSGVPLPSPWNIGVFFFPQSP